MVHRKKQDSRFDQPKFIILIGHWSEFLHTNIIYSKWLDCLKIDMAVSGLQTAVVMPSPDDAPF